MPSQPRTENMWMSWYTARRLQTQLLLWTAVIVVFSVVGTMEVRVRANVRLLQDNLRDRSETTIRSIRQILDLVLASDDSALSLETMEPELRERVAADRTLRRLDIVHRQGSEIRVAVSSSDEQQVLVRSLGVLPTTEIQQLGGRPVMVTSQAVQGTDYGVVAVASMQNIDAYERTNRAGIPAFAALLSLVVILLMHFMYRKIVSKRLDELLTGIRRAQAGEAALIPDARQDEIGIVAKTLNNLMAQAQSFNQELRRQVNDATDDLNRRNQALEDATRQLVEIQKQLVESERMAAVGQLAATFAHEIGSPMTSLSAHIQLLIEDPVVSADQRETLNIMLQQVESTVQIVNEMLKSARRGPSDFVLTDINDILRNVIRFVRPKLMAQKVSVRVQLSRLPLVRGYPLYLQEAFLNIINNASDAMPHGGQLDVESWFDAETGLANIVIADNGPGIDQQILDRVFDHFVTTKAIGQGTGLGLGIVKEIVNSHRGTVQIRSGAGGGTAAHISFPVETTAVLAS